MKVTLKKEFTAEYLMVHAAVRYEEEDMAKDAPMRDGDIWKAIIDIENQTIVDWPQGKTLSIDTMKVCDEGVYTILDSNMKVLCLIDGYVPNNILPGQYGDYLSLDIDENGLITNWLSNANLSDFEEVED